MIYWDIKSLLPEGILIDDIMVGMYWDNWDIAFGFISSMAGLGIMFAGFPY